MAIPLIVKGGAVAWLLWEMFRSEKKAEPVKTPTPAPVIPVPTIPARPPEVKPEPIVPEVPLELPECGAPVLARRWVLCDQGPWAVGHTVSQGKYDALYHPTTRSLVCVVDNETYSDDGKSAWVACVGNFIGGTLIGFKVATVREGEGTPISPMTFPLRYSQ